MRPGDPERAASIGKGGTPHINAAPQGSKLFGIPVKVDPSMPDGVLEFRNDAGVVLARYDLATGKAGILRQGGNESAPAFKYRMDAELAKSPPGLYVVGVVDGSRGPETIVKQKEKPPAGPDLSDPVSAVRDSPEHAARVVARARCLVASMADGDRDRLMEAIEDFDRAVAEVRASRTEPRPPEQEG